MKFFFTEAELYDFKLNLEWVLSEVSEGMKRLDCSYSYSLLNDFMDEWKDTLWRVVLETLFQCELFLRYLRVLGGRKGVRLKEMRMISIMLPSGRSLSLKSPYEEGELERSEGVHVDGTIEVEPFMKLLQEIV